MPDTFLNGLSANAYWPDLLPQLYGFFFTTFFGPFALGFDYDTYSNEVAYRNPILYKLGQRNHYFNFWVFWKWLF